MNVGKLVSQDLTICNIRNSCAYYRFCLSLSLSLIRSLAITIFIFFLSFLWFRLWTRRGIVDDFDFCISFHFISFFSFSFQLKSTGFNVVAVVQSMLSLLLQLLPPSSSHCIFCVRNYYAVCLCLQCIFIMYYYNINVHCTVAQCAALWLCSCQVLLGCCYCCLCCLCCLLILLLLHWTFLFVLFYIRLTLA